MYKELVQAGLPTVQIEIAGSPAFQSLHWEALKDPDLPTPLSLQATMVRKNLRPSTIQARLRPSPTINLLIVTARPSGGQDVGYRTISRPLVELLRQTDLPVQIEILRPGTYEALDHHLQETTTRHGVGYYQVIHFDMHGAVLPFQAFQQEQQASYILFQNRYGRPDIVSYEGEKAFLFFEDPKGNKSDPVEASELADLLIAHQIPIAILNVCQSGKQVGASETSLASRLMLAGIQLVLAMGYSVTVSAAQLLMQTLYRELFAKHELSTAISMARHELYNRKERRAYYNQMLDLEDWLLPVVYQNQPIQLSVRPSTAEELARRHEQNANRYNPSQPGYGFVGRDLDILQIEKRLLTRRNILLVRGMGGAGKTTLLHHLGSWWQTTRFIQEVFYFGYDERSWTRQQILNSIARHLMSKVEYLSTFQSLSLDAQQSLLAQRLRAERHLLILDNLESITGAHLAIQHTLSKKEQKALHGLLKDLAGGQTLVLLGSRGGEEWLATETFVDNLYDLPGLDAEATSALVERILERYSVTRYQQDQHMPALLSLLGGFPLALEVVLANLVRQSPEEILAALQTGNVQINTGNSEKKTENILRCIDYSHSNLSSEAQSLLICLAPFTSVLYTNVLERYSTHLKEQAVLAKLPFDLWPDVLREAGNWGLLGTEPDFPQFLRLQPILPYFLRTRLNSPEQVEVRRAIETAFLALYREYGTELFRLLNSKEPQEKQLGLLLTQYEYENLHFAVNCALDAQTSILAPYRALSSYFNLMQDPQRGLEMAQEVRARLLSAKTEQSHTQVNEQLSHVLDDVGRWQVQLKHYAEAEKSYQQALQIFIELQQPSLPGHHLPSIGQSSP